MALSESRCGRLPSDGLHRSAPLGGPHPGGEADQADAFARDQGRRGFDVLLGEHPRRPEQSALEARADALRRRREGHDRLAGAHVAEKQASHRRVARQVGADRVDGPALRPRQGEGQRGEPSFPRPSACRTQGRRSHGAGLAVGAKALPDPCEPLDPREAVDQVPARRERVRVGMRRVHGSQEVLHGRHPLALDDARRHGIGQRGGARHCVADGAPQRPGAHAEGRVARSHAARAPLVAQDIGMGHHRALALALREAAYEEARRAGTGHVEDAVRGVEPPRVDRGSRLRARRPCGPGRRDVMGHDAHGSTPAQPHERRALDGGADADPVRGARRVRARRTREGLGDSHRRPQVVPADRQRPREIGRARDAALRQGRPCRRPEPHGPVDGVLPCERRRAAQVLAGLLLEERARAREALDAPLRARGLAVAGEAGEKPFPVPLALLGHERRSLVRPSDQAVARRRRGRLEPGPRLEHEPPERPRRRTRRVVLLALHPNVMSSTS